ncbi:MAG: diacylglycerol kinase family lipid kinase [Anaerolineae bacterium]|jgi:YegS/Rv2252/BmrU family lipid kinase|nr:diacylglycerol kinase family lipid kinase [Anaerolineae bacterium]
MRHVVIVNPTAGRGQADRAVPEIETLLKDARLDYTLLRTERPMHAADLAQRAAEDGADVVVAVGGDGTANEVINGLMRIPRERRMCAVGALCVGRGNDFAFGAGIPADLAEGVRTLVDGHRRTIDIGQVTGGDYPDGRYFGNGIGIGFDAVVGFVAARQKHLHGFAGYVWATLKTTFLYYRAPLIALEYDDAVTGRRDSRQVAALMVSVMNGRRMGGGFMMAPEGQPDDGLLDLCIAPQVSRMRIFALVPHFMKGTQATQKPISTGRANHVTVTAIDGALPAHADGETICTEGYRLEIRLLPAQLDVICQASAPATAPA